MEVYCTRHGDNNVLMQDNGGHFGGRIQVTQMRCPKCEYSIMIVPMKDDMEYTISATTEKERENIRLAPERSQKEHIQARTRGIGMDYCECFMCNNGEKKLMNNIAMFVNSKQEGQAVVDRFEYGAHLDYRESEPHWIQVKVGACDDHLHLLERLNEEISKHETVSKQMVKEIREEAVFTS